MRIVEPPAVPDYVKQLQAIEGFAEITEVMRSPDFAQGATEDRRAFLFDTLIFIEGEEHAERKRVYSELVSRESIACYERHLLQPVIDETMARLDASRGPDGLARADFVPMIRLLLHRIAAQVTGVDGVDTDERTERFRQLITTINEATSSNFARGDSKKLVAAGFAALKSLVAEFLQPSLDRCLALVTRMRDGGIGMEALPRDALTAKCLKGGRGRFSSAERPIATAARRQIRPSIACSDSFAAPRAVSFTGLPPAVGSFGAIFAISAMSGFFTPRPGRSFGTSRSTRSCMT